VAPSSDAEQQGVVPGDVVLQVGPNHVQSPEELWCEIDRVRREGRRFSLFMLLPKTQPVSVVPFPGPKWIALSIALDIAPD